VSVYVPPESLLDSKAFRRLLVFSLVGHVALFAGLTFRPRSRAEVFTSTPVMVTVAAPPAPAAAPKPAPPKAAPKPPEPRPEPKVEPPPPPKPVVNEIVIPKEPAPLPKPKPKPVAKPQPKPKTAEQLLAEPTQKVETEHPDSVPDTPAQPDAPPAPVVGGPGTFDPAMAAWQNRVKSIIHSNWSGSQLCKGTPIFDIELDSAGGIDDLSLNQSSGDRYCDESAERAVRKSVPFPASPRGAISVELVLNPQAAP
jgi:protein TonB